MEQLVFRKLSEADLERVVEIHERIIRRPVSRAWREMLARHVAGEEEDYVAFVAEAGGEVVGFIMGEIKVGGFGTETSGWLEMVGVMPEWMGKGVGKALAERLLQEFAARGLEDVFTAVRWDSGDMLAFFKSLGFDRSPFINLHRRLK